MFDWDGAVWLIMSLIAILLFGGDHRFDCLHLAHCWASHRQGHLDDLYGCPVSDHSTSRAGD